MSWRFPLALVLAGGCQIRTALPEEDGPPTATHETRRSYYPGRQQVRMEYVVAIWSDGRIVRDGLEREYAADGTLIGERPYADDHPTGSWRAWFEDGTPRSEVEFGDGTTELPMRFWHANGKLAAEGRGLAGVREGRWKYWSESGALEREGDFHRGLREGTWTIYDELGRKREEGVYTGGRRSGEWRFWDEAGSLTVKIPEPTRDELRDSEQDQ